MNEELNEAIARLEELKSRIGKLEGKDLSDNEFARRYLPYSATVWSKVKSGTYNGNLETIATKSRSAIEAIEAQIPQIEAGAKYSKEFLPTQLAKAVFAAVSRAKAGIDDRRIVVVLAPTGFGKSSIAKYLKTKGAICVEGRQTWKSSYKAFCLDVAQALGRKIGAMNQERVEAQMFQALGAKDGTLFIDEANTMSAASANAIKSIVNRTGYTVVLAAIPQMWDKFLEGNRDEVLQLVNRCQPIIRAKTVTEADVRLFMEAQGLVEGQRSKVEGLGTNGTTGTNGSRKPETGTWAAKIAKAGNDFGGLRTVAAIVRGLAETGEPTDADLEAELRAHTANLAASGIGR